MTEIAVPTSAELAKQEDTLAAEAIAGINKKDLVLPVVKLLQQLSREVTHGDGEAGHFVNSLSGDDLGTEFELVVVHYFLGRFYAPKEEDRVYIAAGPIAPDNWPDAYAGKPFADIPDALEQWQARSNDPNSDFKWGEGPPIQTTHNYIGFLHAEPGVPVRVSLKGASTPAARKANSLISFGGTPWASAIKFTAETAENKKKQPYFKWAAAQGAQSDQATREAALSLASQAQQAQFQFTGDAPDEKPKAAAAPAARGGLDV